MLSSNTDNTVRVL